MQLQNRSNGELINFTLNGKEASVEDGTTIMQLLKQKRIRPQVVTVEINGVILERSRFDQTELKAGDEVEFVYFMGGGGRLKPASNVLELIGSTPIVKLNKIVRENMAYIYAKLESFNPGGSVKDRICLSMIEDAEKKGLIKPGATIVEPTSGNTGIGLAMVAAVKGYKLILTMPETMSLERIYILKSYGAEIVLTDGPSGMVGAIEKAEQIIAETANSFMPQQFINPANPEIHRQTTGREILETMNGKLDAFVAGIGTGGTITGVAEALKGENPNIKIIGVEPKNSAVLSGGCSGPHKIQGIGAGFVPEVLNLDIIDQVITVSDDDAFKNSRRLSKEEGIFAGISAGAATYAALQVASELGSGKTVVVLLPDTGERYFSMEPYFE
ncbi:TPA: cysteine synthase A [Candidatus Poribacteria bacterium]|nr:cysteine synthase A [Candidatus Poribacteria bacterium]